MKIVGMEGRRPSGASWRPALGGAVWRSAALGASVLLGASCDSTSDSVCPSCPAPTGGESSDFGGTPDVCAPFERRVAIDADGAAELGFDVASLEARITRDVDAPLYWRPNESEPAGASTRGYQRETRIQMSARVLGYTRIELDAQSCTGTTCRQPGAPDEYHCSDRLELDVEAEVQTSDGAIAAMMRGYALYGREGFSFHAVPAGTLFANLRDVTGTLELPEPIQPIDSAQLIVNFYLGPDQTSGEISPYLVLRSAGYARHQIHLLFGFWPEPPAPSDDGMATMDMFEP
jgi:hypothetical protein